MRRLPGFALQVRDRVAGFVDRASCPDAKLAGIHAGHPSGCSSTRPPPHTGTRKIKSTKPTARAAALHIALVERVAPGSLQAGTPLSSEFSTRIRRRSGLFTSPLLSESVAIAALSPLRDGALRSALKYPLCSGEGCQVTTILYRSGLSLRNAASSSGHFHWVTFLLGQQKKSDSASGRRSKRPLRRRHAGGNARSGPRAKSLDPCLRRDDGEGIERYREHPPLTPTLSPQGRGNTASRECGATAPPAPQNT